MWHPRKDPPFRGGFQNRDVGYSDHDQDYGPDYGIDYARFSDVPDYRADRMLRDRVEDVIKVACPENQEDYDLLVRNGFVFIKIWGAQTFSRNELRESILGLRGVRDVIIQEVH